MRGVTLAEESAPTRRVKPANVAGRVDRWSFGSHPSGLPPLVETKRGNMKCI